MYLLADSLQKGLLTGRVFLNIQKQSLKQFWPHHLVFQGYRKFLTYFFATFYHLISLCYSTSTLVLQSLKGFSSISWTHISFFPQGIDELPLVRLAPSSPPSSVQFSSVAQSCLTPGNPIDCSTPDGHEFEWTPGVGDGQGGLACCNSWGHKELDTTEWLNWTELSLNLWYIAFNLCALCAYSTEGNGTPLQYSCLENPMDEGAW